MAIDKIKVSSSSADVISANVSFYREMARKYDEYESLTFDPMLQGMLAVDVEHMASHLGSIGGRRMRCLDCGVGTGNLSLRLLQRGWDVTVIDVSPEMLEIFQDKCAVRGFAPTIRNGSVEEFLNSEPDQYDLVSFASVLHHLHSYHSVVALAAGCVRRGGFFYSNFDPVRPKHMAMTRAFDSLDTLLAKLLLDPGDVLPGIRRRVVRLLTRPNPRHDRVVVNAGDLAEYHAKSGVDDGEIVKLLRDSGFVVLDHSRYPVGRTRVTQRINRMVGLLLDFKIIAQRRF